MSPPSAAFPRARGQEGFTLIEITLVVGVLLGLIGVAWVGVGTYKEGANRAICIHQMANVQTAMRSYCNLNQLIPGQPIMDLKKQLIHESKFFASAPFCPSGGIYSFHDDEVPPIGTIYMSCSLVGHKPREFNGW